MQTALTLTSKFVPDPVQRRIAFTDLEANLDLSLKNTKMRLGGALDVSGETAVDAGPGEGALDDPALGLDDETGVGTLDDLHWPRRGGGNARALVAAVGGGQLGQPHQQVARGRLGLHPQRGAGGGVRAGGHLLEPGDGAGELGDAAGRGVHLERGGAGPEPDGDRADLAVLAEV